MLKFALVSFVVAALVIGCGVNIFVSEPSFGRWLGMLEVLVGIVILLRVWLGLSFFQEGRTGITPWWSIKKIMGEH